MADVPYIRPTSGRRSGRLRSTGFAGGRGRYIVLAVVLVAVVVVAAGAFVVAGSQAGLTVDGSALARVSLPTGGGTIQSVDVVTGPHSARVPVTVRGNQIWPSKLVPVGEHLTVDVTVKRPGWISWLSGSTHTLHLHIVAPTASLRSHYLTVKGDQPLTLHFRSPVSLFGSSAGPKVERHALANPTETVTVPRHATAGTMFVSAAPRTWESSHAAAISWFPAGGAATVVASPAPGTQIKPGTPITLTLSKPVAKAFGGHLPPISPATQGSWHQINSHSIVFTPTGYGYGLGAKVQMGLPSGVHLVGGSSGSTANGGTWTVPGGSTVRLQQMLAMLGYLPLNFHYAGAGVGLTPAAEYAAAVKPPAGHFTWRYANTPVALRNFWSPGSAGVMTKGALMAFETDHGLVADGVAGPSVWKTLINAMLAGKKASFGYTFVSVSVAAQRLTLWHDGRTVIGATAVNTGIASAPTATGTYPVFEHVPVTTMSGTNPDGSHYSDPGIQYVSYFNGGDALHAFTRAQYGFPQSLGCVEMPVGVAGQVYPYTPIGTLVHVA